MCDVSAFFFFGVDIVWRWVVLVLALFFVLYIQITALSSLRASVMVYVPHVFPSIVEIPPIFFSSFFFCRAVSCV